MTETNGAAAPGKRVRPIVIAHRGASGYRPEHTLAAYQLAIDMGADFIEPDLVLTRDGIFIARHESALAVFDDSTGQVTEATTNVHTLAEFSDRRTTKRIDGVTVTGWFAEDFTLAEIKRLRARERIALLRPQNTADDDKHHVPTLQEVIDLAKTQADRIGRTIGIYPETKHPSYHDSIGLPMEDRLVAMLQANGWNHERAPVFIQSFEVSNLQYLRTITSVGLVQLLAASGGPWDFGVRRDLRGYAELASAAGLREVARYAQAIGPSKELVRGRGADGTLGARTQLVEQAHAAGLEVHAWTFRAENAFLPREYRRGETASALGDLAAEIEAFRRTGIDGIFTDHPDIALAALVGARRADGWPEIA